MFEISSSRSEDSQMLTSFWCWWSLRESARFLCSTGAGYMPAICQNQQANSNRSARKDSLTMRYDVKIMYELVATILCNQKTRTSDTTRHGD